jgi:hypothetical protein
LSTSNTRVLSSDLTANHLSILITLKKVLLRSSGFGSWKPQKMDQKSLLRIDLK